MYEGTGMLEEREDMYSVGKREDVSYVWEGRG